jgi:hypothetical protein
VFHALTLAVALPGLALALYGLYLAFKAVFLISLVSISHIKTRLLSSCSNEAPRVSRWDVVAACIVAALILAWRIWSMSSADPDDF